MGSDYPAFPEAIARFRAFLERGGWRGTLAWLGSPGIAVRRRTIYACPARFEALQEVERAYVAAARLRLGVLLGSVGQDSDFSYCYLWSPASELEAQYHLMPDGLKLSRLESPWPVRTVSAVGFAIQRMLGARQEWSKEPLS